MAGGQNTPPLSDDEFSILALTIHGAFFERKCQQIVRQSKAWKIQETNYPVTYGGDTSNLDIWAQRGDGTGRYLVLPIECKKNNPDFINWIFFRQPPHRPAYSTMQMIQVREQQEAPSIWGAYRVLQHLSHHLPIADEARDLKEMKVTGTSYISNLTKTN